MAYVYTYLNFNSKYEEAFNFYKSLFGLPISRYSYPNEMSYLLKKPLQFILKGFFDYSD